MTLVLMLASDSFHGEIRTFACDCACFPSENQTSITQQAVAVLSESYTVFVRRGGIFYILLLFFIRFIGLR